MKQFTIYDVRSTISTTVCAHFGLCGGCSKQNIAYLDQLASKEKVVRDKLVELLVQTFHPILPSPEVHFYRNKMEFSFGDERDIAILDGSSNRNSSIVNRKLVHLGLHPKGRFALVTPTPECQLLSEESRKICTVVSRWATELKVPVFVRKSAQGDLRHLVIREGKNTGERMVNLVAKSSTLHTAELAVRLKDCGVPITTFLWTAYDGLSDVAKGNNQKIFWGDGIIRERVGNVVLKVNPNSFMQTNTRAAEKMIELLKSWVDKGESLIDLYCGSGTIGLNLSSEFDNVIGVEINNQAVDDARRNAESNKIANIEFLEGKAEEVAGTLPIKEKAGKTVVVVDPPRPGLHPALINTLLDWAAPQLFYVSCNPETLARDLRALSVRYDILDVQPMDFFPHTDHIETVVRLSWKS